MNPPMYGMNPAKSARTASGKASGRPSRTMMTPARGAEGRDGRSPHHVPAEHVDRASASRIQEPPTSRRDSARQGTPHACPIADEVERQESAEQQDDHGADGVRDGGADRCDQAAIDGGHERADADRLSARSLGSLGRRRRQLGDRPRE